jgi:ribosome-associated protein
MTSNPTKEIPMTPSDAPQNPSELDTSPENETSSEDSLDLALNCAKACIDKNAEGVKVLDLTELSSFTDYFILASGSSDRQVQAIADSVEEALRLQGRKVLATEGYSEGRWVLIDFGDLVVHVFLDALRDYYDLEGLWDEAPRVSIPSEFYLHRDTKPALNS